MACKNYTLYYVLQVRSCIPGGIYRDCCRLFTDCKSESCPFIQSRASKHQSIMVSFFSHFNICLIVTIYLMQCLQL